MKLLVAPMMDWTDRHCRYFHRQLAPSVELYTEMVTTGAIVHGDRDFLLGFDPAEHPVALQLGGSDPVELAECARIAADFGYDEVNLNVGCPSDRVRKGRFGACLMREPDTVRDALAAMRAAVSIPVTVKTRIGVDDMDAEADFSDFVDRIAESGINRIIVHARKAWLSGLSPKENREVPPLDYGRVHRLKARRRDLEVIINGGIRTGEDVAVQAGRVDGVMLGRAAYQNPWILAELEALYGHGEPPVDRAEVVRTMVDYARRHITTGGRLAHVARHMLGLFQGRPGARRWRQMLSQNMHCDDAEPELLLEAMPAGAEGSAGPASLHYSPPPESRRRGGFEN